MYTALKETYTFTSKHVIQKLRKCRNWWHLHYI